MALVIWDVTSSQIDLCSPGLWRLLCRIAPGREPNIAQLRSGYVKALESSTVQVRVGGENRFGIDCSGLVRVV